MRDLVVLGALIVYLPMALTNVFVGYLLWGWAGLIGLNYYLSGFMSGIGYVQLFAIVTLISIIVNKNKNEVYKFEINRTFILLTLFVLHGFICAFFAYPGLVRNWELFTTLAKTALFCALMPMLTLSRKRIHAMVVIIALGISFHGILDGLKFISSAGAHKAQSIAKFGDNNYLGMILVMCIPFLFYLVKYSEKKLPRYGFIATLVLMLLAVIATQSRGALVGLLALAVIYILGTKRKFVGLLVLSISFLFLTQVVSDKWTSRMETIQSADEDASFMGRVKAWQVSSAIALKNPVFGGGFRVVESHEIWDQFKDAPGLLGFIDTPVLKKSGVAAHSIWFEVLADQGFPGLFIFILLILNAFLTCKEIRKLVNLQKIKQNWAADLANSIAATLVVYCVSGSLLSVAYFELPYVCFMLLEVIKLQQKLVTKNKYNAN